MTPPIASNALLPTSLPALLSTVPPILAVHQIKHEASPVSPSAPIASLSTSLPTIPHTSEESIQVISNKYINIEQSHGQTPPKCKNKGECQEQVQYLLKTIDDFKQAKQEWCNSLQHTLTQFNFCVDNTNPDMFYTQDGNDTTTLTIQSDGHFLNGTNQELIIYHQQHLKLIFPLINLGLAYQSLRIKTIQDLEEGITSHITHIDNALQQISPHHNQAHQALHEYKPAINIQSLKIVQA